MSEYGHRANKSDLFGHAVTLAAQARASLFMNSTAAAQPSPHVSTRQPKSHPIGPAPPVPTTAPPAPPSHQIQNRHVNGQHTQNTKGKKRTDPPPPVDPATMYESVRNRIAALEEEEVLEEEEERRFGMCTHITVLSFNGSGFD